MLLPQDLAGLEVTFIEHLQNRCYESCRVLRSYRALGAGTLKRTFFPPLIGSGIPWSPKPAVAAASASVVGVPKKGGPQYVPLLHGRIGLRGCIFVSLGSRPQIVIHKAPNFTRLDTVRARVEGPQSRFPVLHELISVICYILRHEGLDVFCIY